MPHLLRLRVAAAAAGIALAVVPSAASPAGAVDGGAPGPDAGCTDGQVTVVVDFNELGGKTRVACADGGGTASQLFESSGFPLTYTRAPGMQGFVCSVSGRPERGPCTEGDAYWSLWWSDGADQWAYATLGADQLEIEPGGLVGFAWHEGDVDAAPPDVEIAGDGPVTAGAGDEVAEGAPQPAGSGDGDDDGVPTWVPVGLGVVVLGAAAAVPLLRRRS